MKSICWRRGADRSAHRRLRGGLNLARLHHDVSEHVGDRHADRRQHARAGDRREPELDLPAAREEFDCRAGGTMPGDRLEGHGADQHRSVIALVRLHLVHALEGELEVVAFLSIEDRERALAGRTAEAVAFAGGGNEPGGQWVDHALLMRRRHRHAVRAGRRRIGLELGHGALVEHHLERALLVVLGDVGCELGRRELAVLDGAAGRQRALAARQEARDAARLAAAGARVGVVADVGRPGDLADRDAGDRDRVVGGELVGACAWSTAAPATVRGERRAGNQQGGAGSGREHRHGHRSSSRVAPGGARPFSVCARATSSSIVAPARKKRGLLAVRLTPPAVPRASLTMARTVPAWPNEDFRALLARLLGDQLPRGGLAPEQEQAGADHDGGADTRPTVGTSPHTANPSRPPTPAKIEERRDCGRRCEVQARVHQYCPIALVRPLNSISPASARWRDHRTAEQREERRSAGELVHQQCLGRFGRRHAAHRGGDRAVDQRVREREQRADLERLGAGIGDDEDAEKAHDQREPARQSRHPPSASRRDQRGEQRRQKLIATALASGIRLNAMIRNVCETSATASASRGRPALGVEHREPGMRQDEQRADDERDGTSA